MLGELIQRFTLSVSQLNEYANRLLMNDELLQGVLVGGEISNFRRYPSGHWYFSLKDDQSSVRCVMFRQNNRSVAFEPSDGMHVTAGGYASIYLRDGTFQLYVQTMQCEGTGSLYERFEQLKQDLAAKGLFDAAHKKKIPKYPKRIGVVTSPAGAVIRDIVEVSRRRNPNVDILLVPASVQGSTAAREIVNGIEALNGRSDIDVIIIGRGGGSIEDLWAFNEEIVARAVYASKIPIISAVGHETDTTISDYVADLRAPTPSAAAELAVPLFDAWVQFVDGTQESMRQDALRKITQDDKRLLALYAAMSPSRMKAFIELKSGGLLRMEQRMKNQANGILQDLVRRLSVSESKIEAFGVDSVLGRGYAMVLDGATGTPIAGAHDLREGQKVCVVFRDGNAGAAIEDVHCRKGEKNV